MPLNDEQFLRFERYSALLDAHGYWINAEPIEGMEEVFLADLKQTCATVEEAAAALRRLYNLRGLSANLLRELAISLPAPSFNVENYVAAELRAEANRRRA